LGIFAAGTAVGIYFQNELINLLGEPLYRNCPEARLATMGPQSYFYLIVKNGLLSGLLIATPFLTVELLKMATGRVYTWKVALILFLALVAGCYLGLHSLEKTLAAVCSAEINVHFIPSAEQYFSLARWRTFLYGLGLLIIAAGPTFWWTSRKQ